VTSESTETVRRFVEAINAHDVDLLGSLMTADHEFMDAGGSVVRGREAMRAARKRYYELFPDYEIEMQELLSREGLVAVFGVARGTYARDGALSEANRWRVPAAWKAVVRGGKVATWSVFADNEPVRRIMERRRE